MTSGAWFLDPPVAQPATPPNTCTYRKTRNGQWAVYGPADTVKAGHEVTVHTKGGAAKTVQVATVGRPFTVDGQQMVYGYPTPDATRRAPSRRPAGVRTHQPDACLQCGRELTDFDRRAACIPGYHFDCA